MNEEWKRPTRKWVHGVILMTVIAGIIVAFVYLEEQRTNRLVNESLRYSVRLDDSVIAVEARTPCITSAHWKRITSFQSAVQAGFSQTESFDDGLTPLVQLPQLQRLQFTRCAALQDQDVAWLADALPLEQFCAFGCSGITDASIAPLIGWESLQEVNLSHTSITIEGLAQLRDARRDLKIYMNWDSYVRLPEDVPSFVGRTSDPNFGGYQFGQRIDGFYAEVSSPEDVAVIFSVLELQHSWGNGGWTDRPEQQIHELHLSGRLAGSVLPKLADRLPNVRELSLSNTLVTDNIGRWLTDLYALHLANLTEGSDLSGFGDCQSLSSLTLGDGLHPASSELDFLTKLPRLFSLTLEGTELTVADMQAVCRLTSLHAITLISVTDETILPLLDPHVLPELSRVELRNSAVSEDVLLRLTATCPKIYLRNR